MAIDVIPRLLMRDGYPESLMRIENEKVGRFNIEKSGRDMLKVENYWFNHGVPFTITTEYAYELLHELSNAIETFLDETSKDA